MVPGMAICRSLPPAKNPIDRPSGDQNIDCAPSVPASGVASTDASGRTKILEFGADDPAAKASIVPSGDTANGIRSTDVRNVRPGGGATVNATGDDAVVTGGAGADSPR
jgi:hypothetical protein